MRGSFVAACLLAATCRVAFADVIAECNQAPLSEVRVLACTKIIEGPGFGPNEKTLAYESRGKAHRDAGAIRSALADFSEAVRLRPDNGSAFAGRGWTKFFARNWIGAIADYSEAIRLSPRCASLSRPVLFACARSVRPREPAPDAEFRRDLRRWSLMS